MDSTQQATSSANRSYTEEERRDIGILMLSQDFPPCSGEIRKAIECQYSERPTRNPNNKSVSAVDSRLKHDPCKLRNGEMTWCILKTFCPTEGNALQECMNGDFPGKKTDKIPFQCILSWKRFDNCMNQKADDFVALEKSNVFNKTI